MDLILFEFLNTTELLSLSINNTSNLFLLVLLPEDQQDHHPQLIHRRYDEDVLLDLNSLGGLPKPAVLLIKGSYTFFQKLLGPQKFYSKNLQKMSVIKDY